MKTIFLIVILALSGCLFFDSESTPVAPPQVDMGTTIKDTDIEPKFDVSTADSGSEDMGSPKDACDQACQSPFVCDEDKCVCPPGFVTDNETCIVDKIVTHTAFVSQTLEEGVTSRQIQTDGFTDIAQIVPFLSANSLSTDAGSAHVMVQNMDGKFHLTRATASGSVDAGVVLVEFDPLHVKVESGNISIADTGQTTSPKSVVANPNRSFLVFYTSFHGSENQGSNDTSVMGTFDNNGITFSRKGTRGEVKISWFLVKSLGDAFFVKHERADLTEWNNSDKNEEDTRSKLINGTKGLPLLLWSSETPQSETLGAYVRCRNNSASPPLTQSTDCVRNAGTKGVNVSLQLIEFQNPSLEIAPSLEHKLVEIDSSFEIQDLKQADTIMLGQLGTAGATTTEVYVPPNTPPPTEIPGHDALCKIEEPTVEGGQGWFSKAVRTGTANTKASANVQWIRWY